MRNRRFYSDIQKAKRSNRDDFSLKGWIKTNLPAFVRECPDEATLSEAHEWWSKKASQTLDEQLAQDVSSILFGGVLAMALTDNPGNAKVLTSITSSLLGVKW